MPADKYTIKEIDRALAHYERGLTSKQTEELTGVNESVIRRHARDRGVIRPRSYEEWLLKCPDLGPWIIEMHTKQNLSRRRIAAVTPLTQWQVYHYLKKMGKMRTRS